MSASPEQSLSYLYRNDVKKHGKKNEKGDIYLVLLLSPSPATPCTKEWRHLDILLRSKQDVCNDDGTLNVG